MSSELAFASGEAEENQNEVLDLYNALCQLSGNEVATSALLNAFRVAVLETEKHWSEIERRPDYHYPNREKAIIDYLKAQH